MIKKCTSLMLCILLLFALLPQTFATETESVPEGYTAIATPEDLALIRNDMTGNYILTADIDLTEALAEGGSLYNATLAWAPLGAGTSFVNFTGILDGNGHKIYGLKCTGPYGGLIYQNYGTIKNITIASGELVTHYAGAICTYNYGTIYGCQNYASITFQSSSSSSTSFFGGGICGNNNGSIELCANYGEVTSFSNCGGIAGYNNAGNIMRSWNSGKISAVTNAGGIIGYVTKGNIYDAYNAGEISAAYAGGIIGRASSTSYSNNDMNTCYNVGSITGSTAAGGLAGLRSGNRCNLSLYDCFWLDTMTDGIGSGDCNIYNALALSDATMKQQSSYVNYDFDESWAMGTCSYKYPVLQGFEVHTLEHVSAKAATCTADGNIEHWYCSECQGYFTDSEAAQSTTADAVKLTAGHNYVDGVCTVCGEELSLPAYRLDENLSFSMSISAGAEMTVSYSIVASVLSSYSDFYLEITKDVAGGDPITMIYGITEDREPMTVKSNPTTGEALMYQVTYKGINAKEMGDSFSTTLYAVKENGAIYYGNTTKSSIKDYLVNKIDDTRSIAELKTMAVDMLRYGAAAQVRLGYNTENLVTADLTEEQLSYATTEIPEAVNNAASNGTGAAVNTNITVTSRVQLNLSCIYTTATDPNAVKCVITDSEGKILGEIAATNKSGIMFSAIYENVGAKEMRDVINATFYEGETAISQTVSWSVESYVAQVRAKTNVTEDELNMVNAMLTYGDAVAAYMTVSGQ
ncbi:MAG: hypothetical protein E7434_03230 [Ruminococcaceae bacterium]|nr:hypothetical protein [Oscillospiraceae bacterium]